MAWGNNPPMSMPDGTTNVPPEVIQQMLQQRAMQQQMAQQASAMPTADSPEIARAKMEAEVIATKFKAMRDSGIFDKPKVGMMDRIGSALFAGGDSLLGTNNYTNKMDNQAIMYKQQMDMAQQMMNQGISPVDDARMKMYQAQADRISGGTPVFTVDPVSGELKSSGDVPYGARVVSSPVQVPTSEAGRYTLARESIKSLADVKKLLFPDGTPKSFKGDIATKGQIARWGALPKDKEGQNLFRKLSTALSARQLIQTGVAARPDETKTLYKQFYANLLSDPEALFEGLNQLESFYKDYTSVVSNRGATEDSGSGDSAELTKDNLFEGL